MTIIDPNWLTEQGHHPARVAVYVNGVLSTLVASVDTETHEVVQWMEDPGRQGTITPFSFRLVCGGEEIFQWDEGGPAPAGDSFKALLAECGKQGATVKVDHARRIVARAYRLGKARNESS